MANGIDLCSSCKHNKGFRRTNTEATYFRVERTGLLRAYLKQAGFTLNKLAILDDSQIVRATMTVPDAAIDEAGIVKEATQLCQSPIGRDCGAELMLKLMMSEGTDL